MELIDVHHMLGCHAVESQKNRHVPVGSNRQVVIGRQVTFPNICYPENLYDHIMKYKLRFSLLRSNACVYRSNEFGAINDFETQIETRNSVVLI